MEISDRMSLSDLRKAIKEFKKDAPKLTSKKGDLMSFAQKVGIMKSKAEEKSEPVVVPPTPKNKKPLSSELPEELKKPVKSVVPKKSETVKSDKKKSEPVKKSAPSFAQYMSQHKGQGYSMKELAEMFRSQKA
jgi:hypothetical protein